MEHVITIGDIFHWALIGGTVVVIGVVGYIVLVVLNPFSSGN